jgi:NADPH-dependent curcumin reductase CurA
MTEATVNRQWVMATRPVGDVKPEDFRLVESAIPTVGDGDVLIRNLYFGYDASQRIWITEDGGYMPPVQVGQPMLTMGIGQVVESKNPDYKPGDIVEGFSTWEDYSIVRADGPMPLRILPDADYPLSWNLGAFGVGGLTAYFGVVEGLKVTAEDTVVISAATGATGSIAVQIAKIIGAKVIAIGGGPEKCAWVMENTGADAVIDYKNDDIDARLKELAPEGVSAYFDNVGGDMLDTLFLHMAPRGRVLICGAMASGYTDVKLQGPTNYMKICVNFLTVQGIHLFYYADQIPAAAQQLGEWAMQGKMKVFEDVHEGFEKAPILLPRLFAGKAPGKMVLKVADPS